MGIQTIRMVQILAHNCFLNNSEILIQRRLRWLVGLNLNHQQCTNKFHDTE